MKIGTRVKVTGWPATQPGQWPLGQQGVVLGFREGYYLVQLDNHSPEDGEIMLRADEMEEIGAKVIVLEQRTRIGGPDDDGLVPA